MSAFTVQFILQLGVVFLSVLNLVHTDIVFDPKYIMISEFALDYILRKCYH